MENKCVNEIG